MFLASYFDYVAVTLTTFITHVYIVSDFWNKACCLISY